MFTPCTCDRGAGRTKDISDLCVITEFYKRGKKGVRIVSSSFSQVVCMRPGCNGYFSTLAKYVDKIPKIPYNEWLRIKKSQKNNNQDNSENSSD